MLLNFSNMDAYWVPNAKMSLLGLISTHHLFAYLLWVKFYFWMQYDILVYFEVLLKYWSTIEFNAYFS